MKIHKKGQPFSWQSFLFYSIILNSGKVIVMYLKEIQASGFKSFADKINILLDDNITCIVGPNGSGKSNIVDAIRWVLGEQSVKSLRGEGLMADVIFSGSKSRNAQSMASVSLLFDNADHHLPVSFEEVQIKRCVYKTGENEYYLNNERCRLKDITNLFVDSGAGKESFNIISQGKISEILSTRPEERRMIFEEAAGVLKYKQRKEEALRKLDKTHENMKRVEDILGELDVQIGPLKEQSEAAAKYLKAKDELANIEIALIVHDVETMNFDYQNHKKRIDEIQREVTACSTSDSVDTSNIQQKKTELSKLNDKIYQESQELVSLSAKKERLYGEKQLVIERKQMQVDDQKLHDSILDLKEQTLKLRNEKATLEEEVSLKRNSFAELTQKENVLLKQLQVKKEEKDNLLQEIERFHREQLQRNDKIETLTLSIESNSKLSYAVREVLQNPRLRGIHNAIGNLLDTKEEYATALQVSLGGAKEFIVVDNELAAKEAIAFLKGQHAGRATFFPLNVIMPRGIDEDTLKLLKSTDGFVGIASDLVTYDPKYRNIVLNQLGNVIVVDHLDSANRIGRLLHHRYKIVSLEGELLAVGGSITGGSLKIVGNLFQERYALEQCKKEYAQYEEILAQREALLESMKGSLQEFENQAYLFQKEKISLREEIRVQEVALESLTQTLLATEQKQKGLGDTLHNTLDQEEVKIVEDLYACEQEVSKKQLLLQDLNQKRTTLSTDIEELENLVRKNNQATMKMQGELRSLEVSVGKLEVRLDALLATLNEEYGMTFEKAKDSYLLDMEETMARDKVQEIRSLMKSLGVVNLAAIGEYERVSKRYEFLTTQKGDLTKAEDTLLDIIQEMDDIMREKFVTTFEEVRKQFKETFRELFGGGTGDLRLTNEEDVLETGIDMIVSPPGKKLQHISLLSGGEKTLTAIALLFAILKTRPVPFCILDEVEAALDEVNVDNFGQYLNHFRNKTQFIIITHKKKTMEYANVLYGITMQESGVSKLVSVRLENIEE